MMGQILTMIETIETSCNFKRERYSWALLVSLINYCFPSLACCSPFALHWAKVGGLCPRGHLDWVLDISLITWTIICSRLHEILRISCLSGNTSALLTIWLSLSLLSFWIVVKVLHFFQLVTYRNGLRVSPSFWCKNLGSLLWIAFGPSSIVAHLA